MMGNKTMKNLLYSIADWLTSPHSLEMQGWLWIVALPLSIVTLIAFGLMLAYGLFILSWRTIRW